MTGDELWKWLNRRYPEAYYQWHLKWMDLWEQKVSQDIISKYQIKSMIDFGCGIGSLLYTAHQNNLKIKGFEYNLESAQKYIKKEIFEFIKKADVSYPINCEKFDCVISFETAEHLSPVLERSICFVENLANAADKYIFFTAAPPEQTSKRHINLKIKEFWVDLFVKNKCVYLEKETQDCKTSWIKFNCPWYIIKNIMVFKKC
jgi:cyclopropane fatty-acyl-phospholipid synthase-like methyltransferase